VANDWDKWVLERLGRRGTIAAGVVLSALFLIAGGPLFLAGASMSVVGVLAFAAILVGPAIWVLTDARRRGVRRPFFWALLALFGNVIGAVVYVLVRDAQPVERACGACGRQVQPSHAACPWCGAPLTPSRRTCGQCRGDLELDWRYCPYCRSEVGRTSPAA
jgi:RNA polymerase subunit RPABC4/transcription elongation factor Spt4